MRATDETTGHVNLGNPAEFSILQLAELVIQIVGGKSKIEFHPLPQDDPIQRCPDITRAKAKLNWQPEIELKEGLKKTVDYFISILR